MNGYLIDVRNVNHALPKALAMLRDHGKEVAPRGLLTIEAPCPVTTVYGFPDEMVLFDPDRDANPFFHFFEALWILKGRDDVSFLATFLPRMADFSDNGFTYNAPYGYRLRRHFSYDQVETCLKKLRSNPDTRQAVLSIWDPEHDLTAVSKDIPCNDMVAFKIRDGALRMTVFNRSNDVLLGAYGANVVQFSTLLTYMARRLGVAVGTYTQVSDSFHVYDDNPFWERWRSVYRASSVPPPMDPYELHPLLRMGERKFFMTAECFVDSAFDVDLSAFFELWDSGMGVEPSRQGDLSFQDKLVTTATYNTMSFRDCVVPMYKTFRLWKAKQHQEAVYQSFDIRVTDWRLAVQKWMQRRIDAKEKA